MAVPQPSALLTYHCAYTYLRENVSANASRASVYVIVGK